MGQMMGSFSTAHRAARAACAVVAGAVVAGAFVAGVAAPSFAVQHAVAATSSAAQQDAAQTYEWSIDLDCALCHVSQAASVATRQGGDSANGSAPASSDVDPNERTPQSVAEPDATGAVVPSAETGRAATETEDVEPRAIDRYAALHVESFDFTCTSCHEDTGGLAAGHKKLNSGKEATRLRKSKVNLDLCATCHDVETLASTTTGSTAVTDSKGTSVNPHDLPKTDSHLGIGCTDCHAAHNEETSVAQAALATCTSCHHANVFACGTCH